MARRDGHSRPELDPAQPIPIYFQLKTYLEEEILSGRYGPDDRLPTEHELCARFGISRTPVNRALSELADEGLILRRRRHGTFVNPHWAGRAPDRPEVRVLVPEGPWEQQLSDAAPAGVRLNVASVVLTELHHALTHAVAEGRGPDLALIDSVWVPELSAAGFLWPLDDIDAAWVEREYASDFLEPFVSAHRRDGRPVGVQAEADVAGLWYRRDVLDAAGVAPPSTWQELLDAGDALASHARHVLVLPGGSRAGETAAYCLLAMLSSDGVAVLDSEQITLDSPAAVATLGFLQSLVDAGITPAEAVAYEWDRPIELLARGQAAMSLGGSYDARLIAAETGLALGELWEHFGFTAIPAGPHGDPATLAGGMVYAVLRQAAHPDLAMRLIERVTSTDACVRMSRSTAQIPPRKSALELVAAESPFLAATAALLPSAVVRPRIAAWPRISAQLQAMLEAVLTHRLTADAAVAHAADMIGAVTGLPARHASRPA
jgi:multiple sugar transport system substrate-binding protein